MPTFKKGDMWTSFNDVDLFLITTNSAVKRNGAVVMGRGIARQARDRFPGLDAALGLRILNTCGSLGRYGLLISSRWPEAKLGAFQVKEYFSHPADLGLIHYSVTMLRDWCAQHPDAQVALNFPGIGNGHLPREKVLNIVNQLPEQVSVWEYAAPNGRANGHEEKPANPDWNNQVKIGSGRGDTGAFHRAVAIAHQLLAAGRWPDSQNTVIIINDPHELHRQLQMSGMGVYNPTHNIIIYPGVNNLVRGQDFLIQPNY